MSISGIISWTGTILGLVDSAGSKSTYEKIWSCYKVACKLFQDKYKDNLKRYGYSISDLFPDENVILEFHEKGIRDEFLVEELRKKSIVTDFLKDEHYQFFIDTFINEMRRDHELFPYVAERNVLSEIKEVKELIAAQNDDQSLGGNDKGEMTLERELEEYRNYIVRKFTDHTVGRTIIPGKSLSEIYLDHNFEIFKVAKETHLSFNRESLLAIDCICDWLNNKLPDFLNSDSENQFPNVLVVTGEPGDGKSCLCLKFAHDFITGSLNIQSKIANVFLFELNFDGEFILRRPGGGLSLDWTTLLSSKFSTVKEKNLCNSLIFLDGLDEIYLSIVEQGFTIQAFLQKVSKKAQELNCKMVITCRTSCFRSDLRVKRFNLIDISLSQKIEWIENYNNPNFTVEDLDLIRMKNPNLYDLTNIPILFQLIVCWEVKGETDNRAELYEHLFRRSTYEREKDGYVPLEGLEYDALHQKLEELAMQIMKNDGKYITMDRDDVELRRLKFLFYFNIDEKLHLEFLHRSFYQYFLASYIYNGIKGIEVPDDCAEPSISYIWELLSEYTVEKDVISFLREITSYQTEPEELRNILYFLNSHAEKNGFFQPLYPGNERKMKAIKTLTMNLINIMDAMYGKAVDFQFLQDCISFCNSEINLCHANLKGLYSCMLMLNSIDMSNSVIKSMKFWFSRLGDISFKSSQLSSTSFDDCLLISCKYNGAKIMRSTYFFHTEVKNTSFDETSWSYAKISKCKFEGSHMSHSKLNNGIIQFTKLINIDFIETEFTLVNFEYNTFIDCDMTGCKFIQSSFQAVRFSGTDMTKTTFDDCKMGQNTSFLEVKLNDARITSSLSEFFKEFEFIVDTGIYIDDHFFNVEELRQKGFRIVEARINGIALPISNINSSYTLV